jgi:hypothetical protein
MPDTKHKTLDKFDILKVHQLPKNDNFPVMSRRDCGGLYHLGRLVVKGFLKIFIVRLQKKG